MSASEFPHLLSPLKVGPKTLRNRVLVTAHVPRIADNGVPGARYVAYHRAKARGGVAMQITEQRGWHYSTDYLFGTTRGLELQNIPLLCRRAAWIVTVPFDVANLPFAAAAGLFGK